MSIIVLADLRDKSINAQVNSDATYLDAADDHYQELLRDFNVIECDNLPSEANVDPRIKTLLVYWINKEVSADFVGVNQSRTAQDQLIDPFLSKKTANEKRYKDQLAKIDRQTFLLQTGYKQTYTAVINRA